MLEERAAGVLDAILAAVAMVDRAMGAAGAVAVDLDVWDKKHKGILGCHSRNHEKAKRKRILYRAA